MSFTGLVRNALAILTLLGCHVLSGAGVHWSEIMYHPPGTNLLEEWLEIHHSGSNAADISGWRVDGDVDWTFPTNTILQPGARIVLSPDPATFSKQYPAVEARLVFGPWRGQLDDQGGSLRLSDATGAVMSEVHFAPDGEWGVRRLSPRPDRAGKRGWEWFAAHDGSGSSLERVQSDLEISAAHNWTSSRDPGGTPGRPNSAAISDPAPFVTKVRHFPIIPTPGEPVAVTARLVDASLAMSSAQLQWRLDTEAQLVSETMFDDGRHGDGLAGDGVYGAILSGHSNRVVIEYQIIARDAAGNERRWPSYQDPDLPRSALAVVQWDEEDYRGIQPWYHLVLSRLERDFLEKEIWLGRPDSNANANATFIADEPSRRDEGRQIRLFCGVRNRGNGSRNSVPHNFQVNMTEADPWNGRVTINLNSQGTIPQLLGSSVVRSLGMPMAESRLVQLRYHGANLANPGSPQWTSYVANEDVDARLYRRQWPHDPDGNIYRGIRDPSVGGVADLRWLGADPVNYTNAYAKQNHRFENDWSDLVALIDALNNSSDAEYESRVAGRVDVDRWMRYFAISAFLDNQETSLATGAGDDFALYRGRLDPRFFAIPYDFDTVLGSGFSNPPREIRLFQMMALPSMARMVQSHGFARVYHRQLRELLSGFFEPSRFSAWMNDWAAQIERTPAIDAALLSMRAYQTNVHVLIRSQLAASLGIQSVPDRVTAANLSLTGFANAAITDSVEVQGVKASFTAWREIWTAPAIGLHPGRNLLVIRALDESGREVERLEHSVWYDDRTFGTPPARIETDTEWTAANGPYRLASTLSVVSNATLRIAPGVTVELGADADLIVSDGARLLAEGTEFQRIHFMGVDGSTSRWGGMVIRGSVGSPESRISHAHFAGNHRTAVHVDGGAAWLSHLTFGTTDRQYLSLDGSSFVVEDCHFPGASAPFEPVHGAGGIRPGGRGLFLRNYFGTVQGYNDVVDFTGGKRSSGAILHFIDNVLAGGGDDGLDIDGTDAWVEGNVFVHFHRNGSPDSSSGVSGGGNLDVVSDVTLVNNIFYDCDHAVTAKEGNRCVFVRNTVVRQTREGGLDSEGAVFNFADARTREGAGMYIAENIIANAEQLFRNLTSARVVLTNNLIPAPWWETHPGNRAGAARFQHFPALAETQFTNRAAAGIMKEWFRLSPGSAARLANGTVLGSEPDGLQVSGIPRGTSKASQIKAFVGSFVPVSELAGGDWPAGAGFIRYRWRLDSGTWSEPTPSSQPIEIRSLADGTHRVEVEAERDSGLWQNDIVLGVSRNVFSSLPWMVSSNASDPRPSLRIDEIVASPTNGPDWVELFNFGEGSIDLSGMSLTDRAGAPRKFVFPVGTRLGAGARLILLGDSLTNEPGFHLGFRLKESGDDIHLFPSGDAPLSVLDEVRFGNQIPGHSLGRNDAGEWTLCQPTAGARNVPAETGNGRLVRINEWLTHSRFTTDRDFFELYNPGFLPVELSEFGLSDATGDPFRTRIRSHSFLNSRSWMRWVADGSVSDGDEVGFRLGSDFGLLSLVDPTGVAVDLVIYGPQEVDVAQGRVPDGTGQILPFPAPTPGSANPGFGLAPCVPKMVSEILLPMDASWRFNASQSMDGMNWRSAEFLDDSWSVGQALLAKEDCRNCLPAPGPLTVLPLGRITYYFRHALVLPRPVESGNLNINLVADDGAVVHINGKPVYRFNLPEGELTYGTVATSSVGNASIRSFSLPASALNLGTNWIAVEVHQQSAASGDVAFGLEITRNWEISGCAVPSGPSLLLNEILVRGKPGWIEIHNSTTNLVDLIGWRLSDDPQLPGKWVCAQSTVIPPKGHWVIQCDPERPASANNTGFAIHDSGGGVHLSGPEADGGGLADSILFGPQVRGLSIGRIPDGMGLWRGCLPTSGSPNAAESLGDPGRLRINEWMSDPVVGSDWMELFNGDLRPVSLQGLALTDDLQSPRQSTFPPLSFIGTGTDAFRQFFATGRDQGTPVELNFSLRKSGETLGLFGVSGVQIDALSYGSQASGRSGGRLPDGSETLIAQLPVPTPNASNGSAVVSDRDADGIPDDWEVAYQLDPKNPEDAEFDSDGDGATNRMEFVAGTNPRNPASLFHVRLDGVRDSLQLRFPAVPGRIYRVQYRFDMGRGDWLDFETLEAPATAAEISFPLTGRTGNAEFYRVRVERNLTASP